MSEIETLTDEEVNERIRAERREKYKATQKYLLTDSYKELTEYFINKGEELKENIHTEINTREKSVAEKSEVDVVYAFIQFLGEVLDKLGDSDGEKVYRAIIEEQIANGWTNIENKVEELGDVPIYSKLDFIKQARIDYLLLNKRMENWSEGFADNKEEKIPDGHPYEDN
jgi:hypothetical protein